MLLQYNIEEESDMYDLYRRINADAWKELEQGKIDQEELRDKRFRLFFESVNIDKNGYEANAKYLENLVTRSLLLKGAQKFMTLIQERLNMVAVTNGLKEVKDEFTYKSRS
jgi:FMN phosphatase YigB (HAD superfamily)